MGEGGGKVPQITCKKVQSPCVKRSWRAQPWTAEGTRNTTHLSVGASSIFQNKIKLNSCNVFF